MAERDTKRVSSKIGLATERFPSADVDALGGLVDHLFTLGGFDIIYKLIRVGEDLTLEVVQTTHRANQEEGNINKLEHLFQESKLALKGKQKGKQVAFPDYIYHLKQQSEVEKLESFKGISAVIAKAAQQKNRKRFTGAKLYFEVEGKLRSVTITAVDSQSIYLDGVRFDLSRSTKFSSYVTSFETPRQKDFELLLSKRIYVEGSQPKPKKQ